MKQYNVISENYRNFNLKFQDLSIAELIYPNWFSFKAEIKLADNSQLSLEPTGFWDAKIELKRGEEVIMNFKLGWKGIMINVKSEGAEESYLLKHKGLLNSRYVLIDTSEQEILAVKSDFNWSKFKLDYVIETSENFDHYKMKEAFLLTIIHAINYQMAMMSAST